MERGFVANEMWVIEFLARQEQSMESPIEQPELESRIRLGSTESNPKMKDSWTLTATFRYIPPWIQGCLTPKALPWQANTRVNGLLSSNGSSRELEPERSASQSERSTTAQRLARPRPRPREHCEKADLQPAALQEVAFDAMCLCSSL